MSEGDEDGVGETFVLEDMDFPGINLDTAEVPADLPYDAQEDFRSLALLAANGVAPTEEALTEALGTQTGVLLHAVAHASGSCTVRAAVPRLREIASGADDQAAVEAAYALARLGEADAKPLLSKALERPLGAYLSPVLAAGYLAQLGDPSGFGVIREALSSQFLATRMLACKQLLFFMAYHGRDQDVLRLFGQALQDQELSIQGQALAQLRSAGPPARPLLEDYLAGVKDHYLHQLAQSILAGLAQPR